MPENFIMHRSFSFGEGEGACPTEVIQAGMRSLWDCDDDHWGCDVVDCWVNHQSKKW